RLQPGESKFHNWLGSVLMLEGRMPESLGELRKAEALDPLNPAPTVARALYLARKYDDCIEECSRMLRVHPGQATIHIILGSAWQAKGDFRRARDEFDLFNSKVPAQPIYTAVMAHLDAVAGQPGKARELIAAMEHPSTGNGEPPAYDIALAYTGLGDRDQAFEWLNRTVKNGNDW